MLRISIRLRQAVFALKRLHQLNCCRWAEGYHQRCSLYLRHLLASVRPLSSLIVAITSNAIPWVDAYSVWLCQSCNTHRFLLLIIFYTTTTIISHLIIIIIFFFSSCSHHHHSSYLIFPLISHHQIDDDYYLYHLRLLLYYY